ncbi:MAG: hypothetical protein WCE48_04180, partial [Steroidobacteraceae bacterium]
SGTVLEERTATDGSHELTVKLPERELLELAATAGVEILETRPAGAGEPAAEPCAPRQPYLQSDIPASASKLRQA